MASLGSAAVIRIGTGTGRGAATLLDGRNGLTITGFSYGRETDQRPAGPHPHRKRGATERGSISFEVDADDVTSGLFAGEHGTTFSVWYMPDGESASAVQRSFRGYAQIQDIHDFAGQARFGVSIMGDSAITTTAASVGTAPTAPTTTYRGNQAELYISNVAGTLIHLTSGSDKNISGGITLSPTTNFLEDVFDANAHSGAAPISEDGVLAINVVHRSTSTKALFETAAATAAQAENTMAVFKTGYGWYAGGLFLPQLDINTPWDGLASFDGDIPFTWDPAADEASGPWGYGSTQAITDKTSAANVTLSLPTGWTAAAGQDMVIMITKASATESATITISDGTDDADAFTAKTGIYRVINCPSSPTTVKFSAAPASALSANILYLDRIGA